MIGLDCPHCEHEIDSELIGSHDGQGEDGTYWEETAYRVRCPQCSTLLDASMVLQWSLSPAECDCCGSEAKAEIECTTCGGYYCLECAPEGICLNCR